MGSVTPTKWLTTACLVGVLVLLSACGSDSDSSSDGDTSASGASSSEGVQASEDRLVKWYKGPTEPPPADSPAALEGQNVWVITYGRASSAGERFVQGVLTAGDAMGWDVTAFDGQFDVTRYVDGIRQAVADDADAIVLYAIDCSLVKNALQEAKDAGITVLAAESFDCNQTGEGQESLYTSQLTYDLGDEDLYQAGGEYFDNWENGTGRATADWAIANTDGEAKIINMVETDAQATLAIDKGFTDTIEKDCPNCEIVDTVEFTGNDFGNPLQDKTAQALLANPDANVVMGSYDGPITSGIAAAVKASGRADEIFVLGGEGYPANTELVQSGQGQSMGAGYSVDQEAWASVDAVNRLLQGEDQANSGMSIQVWDKDHFPVDDEGYYEPPFDYQQAYLDAWGVGG